MVILPSAARKIVVIVRPKWTVLHLLPKW